MLVTDVPRVLARPAAKLNPTDEKSENEKSRENAEAYFTTPRRDFCTTPKRLCDHSPKKDEPRFDSFQQFAFETVFRLIARRLNNSRLKTARLLIPPRGFDYGVTARTTVWTALLVPLTVLCATFLAVITVPFATFLAVWTGPA